MKPPLKIIIFMLLTHCCTLHDGLVRTKIIFKKKHIGYRKLYIVDAPNLKYNTKTIIQEFGGHGHGFRIVYSDSSTIYFSNDIALASLNYENYKTVGWKGYGIIGETADTTLEGLQTNGLYWKEKMNKNGRVGYYNVARPNKIVFDIAISRFKY